MENLGPPHSIDAERAILGSILRDSGNLHLVLGKSNLQPEHFFLDSHKQIFAAMLEIEAAKIPIDLITLGNQLKPQEDQHHVGLTFLVELTEGSPISQNLEHYATIVKQKYYLRRIIQACQETSSQALNTQGDVQQFIEQVEKEFLEIARQQDRGKGLISAKEALIPTLEELERRITTEGKVTGCPSGFNDLDGVTGGWQRSDLVILAARPGMGKTALALNWLMNAVEADEKNTVAVFTLEMSKEQLLERLLSAKGRIDSTRLRKGDLNEQDQDRLVNAARLIDKIGTRIMVDETPGISLLELRSRCRRYQREKNLSLVIIDYLQLMSGSPQAQKQSREREISEISMGLKNMAKELGVPVIALAQLNRGPDARPDKRPKISDLRESGSMEQDADQIIFVYRDEYYNANSEHAGKAELLIAKNRHGETGSVYLAWSPNYVSFHNLARE